MATRHYKKSQVSGQTAGYPANTLIAFMDRVDELAVPGATPFLIEDDHTFVTAVAPTTTNGFNQVYGLPRTVQQNSATFGEPGALGKTYTHEFFVPGEGPELENVVKDILNKELIVMVKDPNVADRYIQLGDANFPVYCESVEGSSGTQTDGRKGQLIKVTATSKYWYTGAIVMEA